MADFFGTTSSESLFKVVASHSTAKPVTYLLLVRSLHCPGARPAFESQVLLDNSTTTPRFG